ncbi:MAG: dienelactone hydrolase family protein [Anaerolineae bacterium]|nr:dienelactone hydrolase family protein [Anaerolineae bacterium]
MPFQHHGRVEYAIDSGYITIVTDQGQKLPAYWAHPRIGTRFSGIGIFHDWWGMNDVCRMLANFYAQLGYYVIVPDLFNGRTPASPAHAMQLVEETRDSRYKTVDAALTVLERHHRTTSKVAAIGLGMGGTMAFEAAIKRTDLEAAVIYGGFPQMYLGQFAAASTPILALYGSEEPYTRPVVIRTLRDELAGARLKEQHRVEIIPGAAHEFFHAAPTPAQRDQGRQVVALTLAFIDQFLDKPDLATARPPVY